MALKVFIRSVGIAGSLVIDRSAEAFVQYFVLEMQMKTIQRSYIWSLSIKIKKCSYFCG
jgi:hypothetical protein